VIERIYRFCPEWVKGRLRLSEERCDNFIERCLESPLMASWRIRVAGVALFGCFGHPSVSMAKVVDFGGPDAVGNQLLFDREQIDALFEIEALQPYFEFKDRLQEETGLDFGIDYSAVGLYATGSLGDDGAAGGIARLFGVWELVGRGTADNGALVFKVEHRHGYTDVPPSGLGFETGYVGLFEAPFSDQGGRLTNLYWRQRLLEGQATVTAGFLDATDYVDPFALGSPWLHYTNFVFSTGSATIGLPNDATLGVAGGAMLTDNVYAIAGLTDANADPTEPFEGFDSFFSDNDYFTSLEFGWTTSQERLIFDNVHATFWHTDGSSKFGVPNGWGVAASATWWINDQWLPFLRGGWAEDGGSLLQASISTGLGWQPIPGPGRDVVGFGLNWGRPNEDTFGPDLDDQFAAELFYRVNLGRNLALTPDVQVIVNPALNPDQDAIGVFGVRARLAL
jgi:porin